MNSLSTFNSVVILLVTIGFWKSTVGVPIEFLSSHQNNSLENQSLPIKTNLRKELCPPHQTSSLYRFHKESKKCYKIGEPGPCGENMLFSSAENSSALGDCECASDVINLMHDPPLIYHDSSKQCFFAYTQAYCESGDWLVLNEEQKPECVKNKCIDVLLLDPTESSIIVQFKDKCVLLYSKNPICNGDEVITFTGEAHQPTCGHKTSDSDEIIGTSVLSTAPLRCRPGSRRDVLGKCRRIITIRPTDDHKF